MNKFEKEARALLEKHGFSFVKMISETVVLYENKVGIVRADDVFVLRHMTEKAWKFWGVN